MIFYRVVTLLDVWNMYGFTPVLPKIGDKISGVSATPHARCAVNMAIHNSYRADDWACGPADDKTYILVVNAQEYHKPASQQVYNRSFDDEVIIDSGVILDILTPCKFAKEFGYLENILERRFIV